MHERALGLLVRARELIQEREHWIRHNLARNAKGEVVNPSDPEATCFCILGALDRAQHELTPERDSALPTLGILDARKLLWDYLPDKYQRHLCTDPTLALPAFNDSNEHYAVIELFDQVIGDYRG
jgi:hypothetical protein